MIVCGGRGNSGHFAGRVLRAILLVFHHVAKSEVQVIALRNITLSLFSGMMTMSAFACAPADRVIKPPDGSYIATRTTVVINGVQEAADIARVKPEFFKVEGLRPFLGRFFIGEEYTSVRTPVAVLSHRYWTERLRAEPSVIGSQLQIDGTSTVVIGVAPQEFRHDAAGALWLPIQPQ